MDGFEVAARSERFERLTKCGPGSEMGALLRRFWQPVARSDQIEAGRARPIKVMGEDLTLYRGTTGKTHLIGGVCAHRRTVLHTGWIEGDELRCMYHGWKYDSAGQCTEMPAENDSLRKSVRIAGYPTNEYHGLIFAYMGEAPAPEFDLPRKGAYERENGLVFVRNQTWPCNWLQHVENSMDAVHVSFVHQKGKVGTFGEAVTPKIPKLSYAETTAGIRQTATRGENNVRVSDWTFPNNNHIIVPGHKDGDPWFDVGVWMVPMDDENTMRFVLNACPSVDADWDKKMTDYFNRYSKYDATQHHRELFEDDVYPEEVLIELTTAQDYVAQVGQGAIADRVNERLGTSDQGIVMLRNIMWRELDALKDGAPLKEWRRLDGAAHMPKQGAAASA
jgi:5,5'-dehydrodivanillate O-demethylase